MSTYFVMIRKKTTDAAALAEYWPKAALAAQGHPLNPLAIHGALDQLEGDLIEGAVIIKPAARCDRRNMYVVPLHRSSLCRSAIGRGGQRDFIRPSRRASEPNIVAFAGVPIALISKLSKPYQFKACNRLPTSGSSADRTPVSTGTVLKTGIFAEYAGDFLPFRAQFGDGDVRRLEPAREKPVFPAHPRVSLECGPKQGLPG